MDCWSEMEGKMVHDNLEKKQNKGTGRCFLVPGPVIVGAGPSGLATAACLKDRGVPSVILERDECVASLWQQKTYDRLRLHIPKQFCELPLMPYPASYPTYPDKEQFLDYMNSYVKAFDLKPEFNETVKNAEFDHSLGFWRVTTVGLNHQQTEYVCRWLVVATGENADAVMPEIEGLAEFDGPKLHTSEYRNGHHYKGKKVLVIGCGNSGMEVCYDLCNYNARPYLVVRDAVHVLPQEMLGRSTFGLSMFLSKWFSVRMVDRFLLLVSRFILGDTSLLGLRRPAVGPLELKGLTGKTPVLDFGALPKIRAGEIEVRRGVKRVTRHAVEFADGKVEDFDVIILATGYKSNVPTWLKERDLFDENGYPKKPFPHGWKGENGLYTAGFSKRGLLGASMDATKIAQDIEACWKAESKHLTSFASPPPPRPPQSS